MTIDRSSLRLRGNALLDDWQWLNGIETRLRPQQGVTTLFFDENCDRETARGDGAALNSTTERRLSVWVGIGMSLLSYPRSVSSCWLT